VFILKNKIDAPVLRKFCANVCYITLENPLICVNIERIFF
jgi:hypothetical protein